MPEDRTPAPRRLLQFAVLGALAGVAAWLLLVLFDRSVRPPLVIALAFSAALLAAFVVLAFDRQPAPTGRPRRAPADEASAIDTTRYTAELEALERRIDAAMSDAERFRRVLTPVLTDLATQRLRSRRNVDVRSDTARQLLGDDLWRMTISPAPLPSVPTRPQLTEWIGRIEAI